MKITGFTRLAYRCLAVPLVTNSSLLVLLGLCCFAVYSFFSGNSSIINYALPPAFALIILGVGLLLYHIKLQGEDLDRARHDLRNLSTRDALTGLANRALIHERLANRIATARRSGGQIAVVFLDLDRFKAVNDSLGHDIGDLLLKSVARILLRQVREEDAVGRLGSDEFLILAAIDRVDDVIKLVNRILDALGKPVSIDGLEFRCHASLGISVYPDDGKDADSLIRCADLALHLAKNDETRQWNLYSQDMRVLLDKELAIEAALIGAIDRNELELYLQPQFAAFDNRLAGCEALLRWRHQGEWIAPVEFISIAERTGMILEIGEWVIAEACRILQRWGDNAVAISVNVSGRQLGDGHFVSRVFATTRKYRINPDLIEFEITETMLMENLDQCLERLNQLRDAGFSISMDDFGTGYSSLAYLTQLPIDELKIDRSFVSGEQSSEVVLDTIVAMGRALDMLVVAEGVETEQQRAMLIASGCDLLQGFLMAKPMPVDEFESKYLWYTDDSLIKA